MITSLNMVKRIFYVNILITILSFADFLLFPDQWPAQTPGAIGIGWVLTSSFESLRTLRRLSGVPGNLCPYVDKLILAVPISPFLALWRSLPKKSKYIAYNTIAGAVFGLVYFRNLGTIAAPLFGAAVMWGIQGLLTVVAVIASLIDDVVARHQWPAIHWPRIWHRKPKAPKPPKAPKLKKPKRPSLLGEWLRAKHRKVCPNLTFSEETTSLHHCRFDESKLEELFALSPEDNKQDAYHAPIVYCPWCGLLYFFVDAVEPKGGHFKSLAPSGVGIVTLGPKPRLQGEGRVVFDRKLQGSGAR